MFVLPSVPLRYTHISHICNIPVAFQITRSSWDTQSADCHRNWADSVESLRTISHLCVKDSNKLDWSWSGTAWRRSSGRTENVSPLFAVSLSLPNIRTGVRSCSKLSWPSWRSTIRLGPWLGWPVTGVRRGASGWRDDTKAGRRRLQGAAAIQHCRIVWRWVGREAIWGASYVENDNGVLWQCMK